MLCDFTFGMFPLLPIPCTQLNFRQWWEDSTKHNERYRSGHILSCLENLSSDFAVTL